jgi:hypothetical protein
VHKTKTAYDQHIFGLNGMWLDFESERSSCSQMKASCDFNARPEIVPGGKVASLEMLQAYNRFGDISSCISGHKMRFQIPRLGGLS